MMARIHEIRKSCLNIPGLDRIAERCWDYAATQKDEVEMKI
jgi:hypothetical protein